MSYILKQCEWCGDTFKTIILNRRFCGLACAKLGPRRSHWKSKSEMDVCDLCGGIVPQHLLQDVWWNHKDYVVCPYCIPSLDSRLEEIGFIRDESDFPTIEIVEEFFT